MEELRGIHEWNFMYGYGRCRSGHKSIINGPFNSELLDTCCPSFRREILRATLTAAKGRFHIVVLVLRAISTALNISSATFSLRFQKQRTPQRTRKKVGKLVEINVHGCIRSHTPVF
jgi:hypothetical protein